MNDGDFIYGCRSAIQKAVRRGDLDLAHTCFNALWEEDNIHRNWLIWRTRSLVTEEAWYMAGELAELVKSESKEKKDWQRFIYRLTLATKSKDAQCLWYWQERGYVLPKDSGEHSELKAWRDMILEEEGEESNYLSIADTMYDAYSNGTKARKLSGYEKGALGVLLERTKMGGMLDDRQICLPAMMLVFLRGLNKKEINADIKVNIERWKQKTMRTKPRTENIPWYAFDKHTQAGKIAFGIFMRHHAAKYSLNEDDFWSMWFWLESSKIPRHLLKLPEPGKKVTALTSAWWVPFLNQRLRLSVYTPKQAANDWREKISRDVEGCVNWILEKRAEDD